VVVDVGAWVSTMSGIGRHPSGKANHARRYLTITWVTPPKSPEREARDKRSVTYIAITRLVRLLAKRFRRGIRPPARPPR
jgi:hypothetical protein